MKWIRIPLTAVEKGASPSITWGRKQFFVGVILTVIICYCGHIYSIDG